LIPLAISHDRPSRLVPVAFLGVICWTSQQLPLDNSFRDVDPWRWVMISVIEPRKIGDFKGFEWILMDFNGF
jgi:hypothetical protein